MPRIPPEPAYVLHARAYRESSLLLEAFTRAHGRVGLVARGARRPRSRWRGVLQPFRPLLIAYAHRGELGTLTAADQVAAPPPLLGESLYCGLYLNELLMRLLHRFDPHPDVFEHYRDALAALAGGEAPEAALRVFEKQLLEAIGFGLALDRVDGSDDPPREDGWYEYVAGRGLVQRKPTPAMAGRLVSGATLLRFAGERPEAADLPSLKQMMRRVLRHQLGDRPLVSASLFAPRRKTHDGSTS